MTLPLSALLSQVLVAFTIELDNEFEHQMLHRTTTTRAAAPGRSGPWLTSFAMYANCLHHLGSAPLTVGELRRRARQSTNLDGMRRWGYIRLAASDPRSTRPNDTWLVEPTAPGLRARQAWRPLPATIEQRWIARFGSGQVRALRHALQQVNTQLKVAYPDYLPILGYGRFTRGKGRGEERPMPPIAEAPLSAESSLLAALARVLCAFAYDLERGSALSLAVSANLLRILSPTGVRNRDVPRLAGVSNMASGLLLKANLITIGSGPEKLVRLTVEGLAAQSTALRLISAVEDAWARSLGKEILGQLRDALDGLIAYPAVKFTALFEGLQPYPDNGRASVLPSIMLPHYPMVLHRGGYPDGSRSSGPAEQHATHSSAECLRRSWPHPARLEGCELAGPCGERSCAHPGTSPTPRWQSATPLSQQYKSCCLHQDLPRRLAIAKTQDQLQFSRTAGASRSVSTPKACIGTRRRDFRACP